MSHADRVYKYDPPTTTFQITPTPCVLQTCGYMIWALSSDIGFSSQGCYKQIVKIIQRNVNIVGGIAAGVTAIEVNTTYPSFCSNNKCIGRSVLGLCRQLSNSQDLTVAFIMIG